MDKYWFVSPGKARFHFFPLYRKLNQCKYPKTWIVTGPGSLAKTYKNISIIEKEDKCLDWRKKERNSLGSIWRDLGSACSTTDPPFTTEIKTGKVGGLLLRTTSQLLVCCVMDTCTVHFRELEFWHKPSLLKPLFGSNERKNVSISLSSYRKAETWEINHLHKHSMHSKEEVWWVLLPQQYHLLGRRGWWWQQ